MASDRFHVPSPSPTLMRWLGWVNDRMILPGVARVSAIRIPDEDAARLRSSLDAPFVLCPNHPEVFTDWMLDKWLCSRFAPRAAAWADAKVVNGMGRAARRFWLANGLVAAVHGDELERALAYSAQSLVRGDGALIHPEGGVNWDNEALGDLRSGALRIAVKASALSGRQAALVPVCWFLRFRRDASKGLGRELAYVEQRLGVPTPTRADAGERVGALYTHVLEREAREFDIEVGPRSDGFAARFDRGFAIALERLRETWSREASVDARDDRRETVRAWQAAARALPDPPAALQRHLLLLERMYRLLPAGIGNARWTQEQVAERVKRLRLDWLSGAPRDDVSRFIPHAVAPREVFVSAGEAVAVGPASGGDVSVLAELRARMVDALERARRNADARLGGSIAYANPLLA